MSDSREKIFIDWFQRYKGLIFKVVRAYTASVEDQNDLFQEILMQLWSSIPGFEGGAKETTWIYRVALNTALVWKRKKSRRKKKYLALAGLMRQGNIEQGRGDLIQDNEVIEQVYAAIRELPRSESSIILLYLDGLSYEKMAEVLGISVSNVGVRLNRAKKKLAQLLKGLVDDVR